MKLLRWIAKSRLWDQIRFSKSSLFPSLPAVFCIFMNMRSRQEQKKCCFNKKQFSEWTESFITSTSTTEHKLHLEEPFPSKPFPVMVNFFRAKCFANKYHKIIFCGHVRRFSKLIFMRRFTFTMYFFLLLWCRYYVVRFRKASKKYS